MLTAQEKKETIFYDIRYYKLAQKWKLLIVNEYLLGPLYLIISLV
jgi:hypothetical protein